MFRVRGFEGSGFRVESPLWLSLRRGLGFSLGDAVLGFGV